MVTMLTPILILAISIITALRFGYKIPTHLRIYRFHAMFYGVLLFLELILSGLMERFPAIDWWVMDAIVYLEHMLSVSGIIICILLVPVLWWLERRRNNAKVWRIGQIVVTIITFMPYILVAWVALILSFA